MIQFEHKRIPILCAPDRNNPHPHREVIDAFVGVNTGFACHPVPIGSMIEKDFPDAWMVSYVLRGSAITTFPSPANKETAQKLIEYLYMHRGEASWRELIEQYATYGEGQWFWPDKVEEGK